MCLQLNPTGLLWSCALPPLCLVARSPSALHVQTLSGPHLQVQLLMSRLLQSLPYSLSMMWPLPLRNPQDCLSLSSSARPGWQLWIPWTEDSLRSEAGPSLIFLVRNVKKSHNRSSTDDICHFLAKHILFCILLFSPSILVSRSLQLVCR